MFRKLIAFLKLFLDLLKAFDCVSHSILLAQLGRYGSNENTVSYISSYLTNKYHVVHCYGVLSSIKVFKVGEPQRSVLGLTITFFIFIKICLSTCTTVKQFCSPTILALPTVGVTALVEKLSKWPSMRAQE